MNQTLVLKSISYTYANADQPQDEVRLVLEPWEGEACTGEFGITSCVLRVRISTSALRDSARGERAFFQVGNQYELGLHAPLALVGSWYHPDVQRCLALLAEEASPERKSYPTGAP